MTTEIAAFAPFAAWAGEARDVSWGPYAHLQRGDLVPVDRTDGRMIAEIVKSRQGAGGMWIEVSSEELAAYAAPCSRCGTRQLLGQRRQYHLSHAHGADLARLRQVEAEAKDARAAAETRYAEVEALEQAAAVREQELEDLRRGLAEAGLIEEASA